MTILFGSTQGKKQKEKIRKANYCYINYDDYTSVNAESGDMATD